MIRRLFSLLAVACVAVALGVPSGAARAGIQDFYVVNDGAVAIWYIHVSPNYADDWEEDVLGNDVLMSGDQFGITMTGYGNHCFFDIKVEDANGYAEAFYDVNLCEVTYVYFPDSAPVASSGGNIQDFIVANNSSIPIWYLYVSPNYADNWEEDVLGDDVLMPGQEMNIIMPGFGGHCWFDVKFEDQYGDYTREYYDVNLCEVLYVYYP